MSRKWLLCGAAILWSCTSIATALSDYYWELVLFRMLLGLFEACLSPAAYSLIADFFPPETRTVANAMFSVGIYLGAAFSNLSIIIILAIGWRATYGLVGCFGIFVALIGIFVIREPERGVFEPKKMEEEEDEREKDESALDAKGADKPVGSS